MSRSMLSVFGTLFVDWCFQVGYTMSHPHHGAGYDLLRTDEQDSTDAEPRPWFCIDKESLSVFSVVQDTKPYDAVCSRRFVFSTVCECFEKGGSISMSSYANSASSAGFSSNAC